MVTFVDPEVHDKGRSDDTLLVKRMRRVRAYLTVPVNAIVVTFVDPEAYDKGRSVTVLLNAICHVR